ncbi:MAG: hypothetical protein D6689_03060 [Deltaproteobacteria bacterium]|nr:MAG: hypothetical protein D6689_03060 [Deltaproteobacteria bacterium]
MGARAAARAGAAPRPDPGYAVCMARGSVAVLACAATVAGCSDRAPAPAPDRGRDAAASGAPAAGEPAPATAVPPDGAGPRATVTPGDHATSIEFVGWTAAGDRFALRVAHGYDDGSAGRNWVEIVRVVDAATGAETARYRGERIAGDEVAADDPLSAVWNGARPAAAWRAFRRHTPLVAQVPALASARGWRIAAAARDDPPAGSRFAWTERDGRIETRWWNIDADPTRLGRRPAGGAPAVTLVAERDSVRHELMDVQPPWSYADVADAGGTRVDGVITAYWSPGGDRAVIVVSHAVRGADREHGPLVDATWAAVALAPAP